MIFEWHTQHRNASEMRDNDPNAVKQTLGLHIMFHICTSVIPLLQPREDRPKL